MANRELDNITHDVNNLSIRGTVVRGHLSLLPGSEVEITLASPSRPSQAIEEAPVPPLFVLSPAAASLLTPQKWGEPGTKVLGPRSIEYWSRGGGFKCVQRMKQANQDYISPRCRNRGQLAFDDLVAEGDVIVVRNSELRSQASWWPASELGRLPRYSLLFTEYLVEGYSFCTIWHKEAGGWLERATTLVDQATRLVVGLEIAPTIYQPAQPGHGHVWELYAI